MSATLASPLPVPAAPAAVQAPLRVGVIASLKRGLEHFIDRELRLLEEADCRIDLFPAKHRPGLYNPRPGWRFHPWSAWRVLAVQPLRLLADPARYLRTLADAVRHRAIGEFALAAYFAPAMRELDVLYATFGDRKLFIGYFAKQLLGTPLAVEIHAYELYDNPNPALFRRALAACDQIIAVTEYNRAVLERDFHAPADKVAVVRLSVELAKHRPRARFVVLVVAYFVEKKGHEVLLRAVKALGRDDIEIWIVGGPRDSADAVDVPKLVEDLQLGDQVAFFGEQRGAALQALYRACDVFCLPSRHDRRGEAEGFPSVLIEAMASAKPVITTRHVEIPRIVEQVLVPENDVAALAEALDAMSRTTPAERAALGARNRELAEAHFSTRNAARTAELLRDAAARCAAAPTGSEVDSAEARP